MSTEIKRLEFELEKASNGLAMPYDRERVWQLEAQLREARQRVRMRKAKHMAAKLRLEQVAGGCIILRSNAAMPRSSHAAASPSIMHDRDRSPARAFHVLFAAPARPGCDTAALSIAWNRTCGTESRSSGLDESSQRGL
jgi:hypothetical protein